MWVKLVKAHEPSLDTRTFFLVGNKCDLYNGRVVSEAEAVAVAKELDLKGYYELSAKTMEGLSKFWQRIPLAKDVEF